MRVECILDALFFEVSDLHAPVTTGAQLVAASRCGSYKVRYYLRNKEKGVIGFVHVTPFYDVCLAANDVTSQPLVMMYHLKVK